MGCIGVTVRRPAPVGMRAGLVSQGVGCSAGSAFVGAECSVGDMAGISARIDAGVSCRASASAPVGIEAGIVCDVVSVAYLRVMPSEPMWISVDYGVDYDVMSNTDWIVE